MSHTRYVTIDEKVLPLVDIAFPHIKETLDIYTDFNPSIYERIDLSDAIDKLDARGVRVRIVNTMPNDPKNRFAVQDLIDSKYSVLKSKGHILSLPYEGKGVAPMMVADSFIKAHYGTWVLQKYDDPWWFRSDSESFEPSGEIRINETCADHAQLLFNNKYLKPAKKFR